MHAETLLIKLDEAALGTQTTMIYESNTGDRVLCKDTTEHDLCKSAYDKNGGLPSILWLGNSQLPAINRFKPGDATAPTLLHEIARKRGIFLVTYAQPNANLAEHAIVFGALKDKYKPKLLILPVFLDDIREQGIRPNIAAFLDDVGAREAVETSAMYPHLAPLLTSRAHVPGAKATFQQRVETAVNGTLGRVWPLWAHRGQLRGLFAIIVHTARNRLLGINAQTKRRVDREVYAEKMRILTSILRYAKDQQIKTLLYIPPYRRDIDGPYIEREYDTFKNDLRTLATEFGAHFSNLEDVVPGPEWGTVVDAVFRFEDFDFMHFTGEGHRRLVEAIDAEMQRIGF